MPEENLTPVTEETPDNTAVTGKNQLNGQTEEEIPDGSFSKKTVRKYGIILAAITVVTIICIAIAFYVPKYFGM